MRGGSGQNQARCYLRTTRESTPEDGVTGQKELEILVCIVSSHVKEIRLANAEGLQTRQTISLAALLEGGGIDPDLYGVHPLGWQMKLSDDLVPIVV